MRNSIIKFILILSPVANIFAEPGNPAGDRPVPIDQYDYSLIIAAILIIAISAILLMRKKLNRA